ncbi:magnesium transporter NIPA-domain-containing protein [Mycena epipterygia]|nr:magnesium transporter NIPA-domain-containing protein [Mycena epipterygia]
MSLSLPFNFSLFWRSRYQRVMTFPETHARSEMFTDLAKQGWAVYFVAPPPAGSAASADAAPAAASISLEPAAFSLIAAKLLMSSSPASTISHSIPPSSTSSPASSSLISALLPTASSSSASPSAASAMPTSPVSTARPKLKILGIILAVASGLLIGSSFVFKKKGLLRSQAAGTADESVKYLKSPLWWLGMSLMILGELCNFAGRHGHAPWRPLRRRLRDPLLDLPERTPHPPRVAWLRPVHPCATVIALNPPQEATVGQIVDFQKLFLSIIFLVYVGMLLAASLVITLCWRRGTGRRTCCGTFWCVHSMIGGISVSVTTGLGAAIVTTVYYLNVALALFNTSEAFLEHPGSLTNIPRLPAALELIETCRSNPDILRDMILVICVGNLILQISKSDQERRKLEMERQSTFLAWSSTEVSEKKYEPNYQSAHTIHPPLKVEQEVQIAAESPEALINAPRGSLRLTLAGIIQAWRHGVNSDESLATSEVDIGELAMVDGHDEYRDDYGSTRSLESIWMRRELVESRRRRLVNGR